MDNINDLFGIVFDKSEMILRDLPVYLSLNRSVYKMSYSGIEFILIELPSDDRFSASALKKQAGQISSHYGLPVAFRFDNVSRQQRDSMIAQNIPFISGSGQLFLPFLGIALQNRFVGQKEISAQKMMPVTQALFLYLLYHSKGAPIIKKDAAEKIGVTKMSITRASDQLSAMGLIRQDKQGKETYMLTTESGLKLYEKAKDHLISPVMRTITTMMKEEFYNYPLSGESVLAVSTTLNGPRIPARAVYKNNIFYGNLPDIDVRWESGKEPVLLEIWKYDPDLFIKGGVVDPVSLAMCFEDNADERIEGAIEEYLEVFQW